MTVDPSAVLRDTRRLHGLRAMVGGPLTEAGHAVRWHNLTGQNFSYARCVKRGCSALWIMDNRSGELAPTPLVSAGPCAGQAKRKL